MIDWGIHVGAAGQVGEAVWGFSDTRYCISLPTPALAKLKPVIADPTGFYVDVHTEDFPDGAIRGQLTADTPDTAMETPTSPAFAVVGLVVVLLAGVAAIVCFGESYPGERVWRRKRITDYERQRGAARPPGTRRPSR